jgi:Kyakuja-Dileera-Zisupton transposase
VCIDANFTQKRRAPARGVGRDPPVVHPETCWLSDDEILAAKAASEAARPPQPQQPTAGTESADTLEKGMKVTAAVLDGCLESFTAADEKRTKANTKFFADTGVMVLACRHDQPVFLANMTTPGERQFYALALLEKFFSFIPHDVEVGVLYDIACQLERSCHKWGFIPDIINRISWAVSVFHAYGHQWACQLIYHPRKCEGFGLSDGEGCERFWFSIQNLIPSLRVSGVRCLLNFRASLTMELQYHQRLFTIDLQVQHVRETSLHMLGKWIARKWKSCSERRAVVVSEIEGTGLSQDYLEAQWKDQVASQTKPLHRATSQLANKEIQKIIDLIDYSDSLRKEIQALDRRAASGAEADALQDLLEQREDLVTRRGKVDFEHQQRSSKLGLTGKKRLKQLMGNKFLELLVKARAVKERLRARLQGRKFELERVDRAFKRGTHDGIRYFLLFCMLPY